MMRNSLAAPRFVILYFFKNCTLTSIAALVAASGYDIEISLTYRSVRVTSLGR